MSGLYTIWNHQRLRTFISSGSLLTLNYKTPSSYYSSEFQLQYKGEKNWVVIKELELCKLADS